MILSIFFSLYKVGLGLLKIYFKLLIYGWDLILDLWFVMILFMDKNINVLWYKVNYFNVLKFASRFVTTTCKSADK